MPTNIDPKMLASFSQAVQGYWPKIRTGVQRFLRDTTQQEAFEDAYQQMQSIKDAADMLSLPVMSQLVSHLEDMMEDIATGPRPIVQTHAAALRHAVERLEQYVTSLLANDGQASACAAGVVQAFRRLKGLPNQGDQEAAERLLGETVEMPPEPTLPEQRAATTRAAPQPAATSAPAFQDDVSEELIEGFLTEAEDYLNTIGRLLPRLGSGADQRESLQSVRRSIHTFKGAAGVVGFRAASQLAHRMEDLMDQLYEGSRTLTNPMKDLLLATFDVLDEFVRAKGHVSNFDQATQKLYGAYTMILGAPSADTAAGAAADMVSHMDDSDDGMAAQFDDVSDELIEGFLMEAEEHVNLIGRTLPDISDAPEHRDVLQRVRRSAHTLKGAAGVVGFRAASELSKHMEDLIDEILEGSRSLTAPMKDLFFATFDALDEFVRAKGRLGHFSSLVQKLGRSYAVARGELPEEEVSIPVAVGVPAVLEPEVVGTPEADGAVARQLADVLRVPIDRVDDLVRLVSELVISRSTFEQYLARLVHQVGELRLSIERLRRTTNTVETQFEVRAVAGQVQAPSLIQPAGVRAASASTVRTSTANNTEQEFDLLEFDRYNDFTLVARELTETTADIGALGQEFGDVLGDFDTYLTRQGRLTSEIQDKLMRLRMVPLATIATRLHRAVRVTARERGKEAELVLEGEEVEFDKTVLEEMAEPLLHMLRNAVDHGLETPAQRQAAGKPTQGRIALRAYREGTQVVLQLSDDGSGLDPQRLRATALRQGLATEADIAQMAEEQLYQLIFTPGFSTAREVSEISGRGVGMDVVQATVNRLKGRVVIESVLGKGVTFTVRLPLTLAISRVLLVKEYGEHFAIPLADVSQIMRLETNSIERVGDTSVIRVDGEVIPVVRLGERLHMPLPLDSATTRLLPVVITQAGDKKIAFIVDQLIGGREVVVKTLGSHLRRVDGVIGCTLLGDGSVVLILNPIDLVREERRRAAPRRATEQPTAQRASAALEILIVDDSFSVRRVVSNLIKHAGWLPILAKDGLEALDIIQRSTTPPDLILLDVEMPQMDGYELTSTLRAQAAYRELPIVMLTSRAGEKHRQKAFEVGATDYLVKPYQDEVLLGTIRRLVPRAHGNAAA